MTVVETPGFLRDAATAIAESERDEVVSFLAANRMPVTSCRIQEFRWRAPGRGKRGGFRVIYYYHNESERNEMKALLPRLVAGYRKRMAK